MESSGKALELPTMVLERAFDRPWLVSSGICLCLYGEALVDSVGHYCSVAVSALFLLIYIA